MSDKIKRIAEARQKKGWTQEEIKEFAKRRSKELKNITKDNEEPANLASGTQKTIEEICKDDEKEDEQDI